MANDCNLGFEHRFAFEPTGETFDSSSRRFEVKRALDGKQSSVLDSEGLLGHRGRREDRTRFGITEIRKTLDFDVSPNMLDFFLRYILGASEATDTFATADSLTGFDMVQDPFGSGSEAAKFSELYVNRARFTFGAGRMVEMSLECIGKTITLNQSFTAEALGATSTVDAPYVFYDSVFTMQGGAVEVEEGELIIDNFLDVKFRNSRTATSIRATDRVVTLVTNVPMSTSNWNTYFGDQGAASGTVAFNNGTVATTFTLQKLRIVDAYPSVNGKGEVPLVVTSIARYDGTTPDISVTVTGGSL